MTGPKTGGRSRGQHDHPHLANIEPPRTSDGGLLSKRQCTRIFRYLFRRDNCLVEEYQNKRLQLPHYHTLTKNRGEGYLFQAKKAPFTFSARRFAFSSRPIGIAIPTNFSGLETNDLQGAYSSVKGP